MKQPRDKYSKRFGIDTEHGRVYAQMTAGLPPWYIMGQDILTEQGDPRPTVLREVELAMIDWDKVGYVQAIKLPISELQVIKLMNLGSPEMRARDLVPFVNLQCFEIPFCEEKAPTAATSAWNNHVAHMATVRSIRSDARSYGLHEVAMRYVGLVPEAFMPKSQDMLDALRKRVADQARLFWEPWDHPLKAYYQGEPDKIELFGDWLVNDMHYVSNHPERLVSIDSYDAAYLLYATQEVVRRIADAGRRGYVESWDAREKGKE